MATRRLSLGPGFGAKVSSRKSAGAWPSFQSQTLEAAWGCWAHGSGPGPFQPYGSMRVGRPELVLLTRRTAKCTWDRLEQPVLPESPICCPARARVEIRRRVAVRILGLGPDAEGMPGLKLASAQRDPDGRRGGEAGGDEAGEANEAKRNRSISGDPYGDHPRSSVRLVEVTAAL